jgi:hypothetical protein
MGIKTNPVPHKEILGVPQLESIDHKQIPKNPNPVYQPILRKIFLLRLTLKL